MTSPPTAKRSIPWKIVGKDLGLVGLVITCYLPALRGDFIWDDDWWITENVAVQSPVGITRIWTDPNTNQQYYPLTSTSFWLEFRLWGRNPFGYHLTNVLLHACNAVLLGHVLRRIRIPGGWWAAALFAVHPVHAESVAWITERKNVLSCLFALLSTQAYFRFMEARQRRECFDRVGKLPSRDCEKTEALAQQGERTEIDQSVQFQPGPYRRDYLVALLTFLAALLSKTATCVLPLAWLVVWCWRNSSMKRGWIATLIPFLVLGGLAGGMTAWLEVHHAGAQGESWDLSWLQRIAIAGRAVWFDAWKLIWPANLMFVYPRWSLDGNAWELIAPALALAIVTIVFYLARGRIGSVPVSVIAAYVILLFPALGFFNVFFMRYSFVQDHFQYLASLVPIAALAAIIALARAQAQSTSRSAITFFCVIALGSLGAMTWTRAGIFQSSESLWRDSLAKNPDAWLPHNNLGVILLEDDQYADAVIHLQRALDIRPSFFETHFNLGYAYAGLHRLEDAIASIRRGLDISPNHSYEHYAIGHFLVQQGNIDQAVRSFRSALDIEPFQKDAHLALGEVLVQSNRDEDANIHFQSAVDRGSPFASDYRQLAELLLREAESGGRTSPAADADSPTETSTEPAVTQAIRLLRQAVALDPDDDASQFKLGLLLYHAKMHHAAADALESAVRLAPDNAPAAFILGTIRQAAGDRPAAIAAFQQAVQADPQHANAHYNLGTLWLDSRQAHQAVEHLTQAVRIMPDFADAHHNLAIALYQQGEYETAWRHVRIAERMGRPLEDRFVQALSAKRPEPFNNADRSPHRR